MEDDVAQSPSLLQPRSSQDGYGGQKQQQQQARADLGPQSKERNKQRLSSFSRLPRNVIER